METNNVNDCLHFWGLIVRSDRDEQQKYAGPVVFGCILQNRKAKPQAALIKVNGKWFGIALF